MSWLLFLDESGHDHKNMPYEVRGGITLHAGQLWPFVQPMQRLELESFGCLVHEYNKELKGSTLVDKKRFKFANLAPRLDDGSRRKHCRGFLTKGLEKKNPTREEFTAYGQACLDMASGIFQLLVQHEVVLFAVAIPPIRQPKDYRFEDYLRKDQVFLLERFFYFLEEKKEHGLMVVDEVEKVADRAFVRRLDSYFTKSETGRYRSQWIVPAPFFVSSDMIHAADLCIYCVNWGFRVWTRGMTEPTRPEIAEWFGPWMNRLQYRGEGYRDGNVFQTFGVCYVPNPYGPGRA